MAQVTASSETCVECGNPVDLGDEPGEGYYDNGAPAPLCSVACTEKFYSEGKQA